jgi:WD40 repeat protein
MDLKTLDGTDRDECLAEAVTAYLRAVESGRTPDPCEWQSRYPAIAAELAEFFAGQDQVARLTAPLRAAATPLTPDFGDYELLEEIARGGMGVVYQARQKSLNRVVALKMVLGGRPGDSAELQRFRREAEAVASLDHPNIVPIYEVGEHGGWHYFSMKLVEGGSLAQHLERFRGDPRAAAALVATVARAVHHAHQRGILHRDLKPANILLDAKPQAAWVPLVTDFGLARRVEGNADLTQTGAILGTPSYMAPEQAAGGGRPLTTAADVHSLGAILYELLTGRPPFQADTPLDTLLQVREREPSRPRSLNRRVDRDLETVCLKCLEKEPARRYGSAEALADDLERWLRDEPVRARRAGTAERVVKWARRRPALASLAALLVLSTVLGFSGITWKWQEAQAGWGEAAERARAETEARQAETEARQAAEAHLYIHRIALAHREWLANNVARADELLDECPQGLRQWEWHYLKRLCHADLLTLRGHTGEVRAVAWSPDGKLVASAGWSLQGGEVIVWDAATGQELHRLGGHTEPLASLAFSPDGRRLATLAGRSGYHTHSEQADTGRPGVETRVFDSHGELKVWDVATGAEVLTIPRGGSSVAFSPDGTRLAVAGIRWPKGQAKIEEVTVWDAGSGKQLRTLVGASQGLAFSPDGTRLASFSWETSTLTVWDARTGQKQLTIRGAVGDVALSPNGKRLAAVYAGNGNGDEVHLWDAASGKDLQTLRGHGGQVTRLAFSPDGKRLATASLDQTVRVWDTESGQFLNTLRGHTREVLGVAFSPDGRRLASAGRDRAVKVWDAGADQEARTLLRQTYLVHSVALSPDGGMLAAGGLDRTIHVWGAAAGLEVLTLRPNAQVYGLTFSPDGKRLAATLGEGWQAADVRVWDPATGKELSRFRLPDAFPVRHLAFSPDGRQLLVAGGSYRRDANGDTVGPPWVDVRVWDALAGKELVTLREHSQQVLSAAFSPDGKRVATGSWVQERPGENTGDVRVWDLATGRELLALRGGPGAVFGLAFSPDGRLLAAAGGWYDPPGDAGIKVWDVTTGREVHTLRGHTRKSVSVAFSPDGRRLVSAGEDETVKLWDVATGQELLTLRGHNGIATDVVFSPDGRQLFSVSGNTVRLWDATPLGPARGR